MADWLPPLITLDSCGGDWARYVEEIYARFKRDFVDSRPLYNGVRLGLRKHPVVQGKETTFWHLISEGETEEDRLPDLRRCERIGWVRPLIEQAGKRADVKIWKQQRKGKTNIAIAIDDFSYIVFLGERSGDSGPYLIPLTAYHVEGQKKRDRYRKEWGEYNEAQKSKTASKEPAKTEADQCSHLQIKEPTKNEKHS
jgi:hypothetical protein